MADPGFAREDARIFGMEGIADDVLDYWRSGGGGDDCECCFVVMAVSGEGEGGSL